LKLAYAPLVTLRWIAVLLAGAALSALALGCQSGAAHHQAAAATQPLLNLSSPEFETTVVATCDPPIGWIKQPLKSSPHHTHQIWLSPTGRTAYGVVHFGLPFPLDESFVLDAFLARMKKMEGDANLVSKYSDPNLPGLRFVAEGGMYRINGNLIVHAFQGWAIYAGTLRGKPVDREELDLAQLARENTRVGSPTASASRPIAVPSLEGTAFREETTFPANFLPDRLSLPGYLGLPQGFSTVCAAGKSAQASTAY
jgi:hypothetical protein